MSCNLLLESRVFKVGLFNLSCSYLTFANVFVIELGLATDRTFDVSLDFTVQKRREGGEPRAYGGEGARW